MNPSALSRLSRPPRRPGPVHGTWSAGRTWPARWPALITVLCLGACGEPIPPDGFPVLVGDYFGQTPPGAEPELFAPGLITTGLTTRDVAMTPDGDEIYFCVASAGYRQAAILVTRRAGGRWTEPEVAPFCQDPRWLNLEPAISPDGRRFFFLSNRPDAGEEEGDQDIWVMERIAGGWSEPVNLKEPVNTPQAEFFPSVTRDGTLYFCRAEDGTGAHHIYRSRPADGRYQEPERLPAEVNSGRSQFNAFVAPDESYVIVPVAGRPDSFGGVDYYISFRDAQDRWTGPYNLGDRVNSADGSEWSPYVSPDGRYLFFMSARQPQLEPGAPRDYARLRRLHGQPQSGNPGLYWMEAGVIDELRARAAEEAAHD